MEDPVLIYLRLIDYNSTALTSNGTHDANIVTIKDAIDPASTQFIKIVNYYSDVEQALNIGSQSTGAGAGKITFNPLRITKYSDALSPILLSNSGSGTAFKTVEVFFTDEKNILRVKHTFKLVAVKTMSWSAVSGELGIVEIVGFEYGGFVISVFQQGSATDKPAILQFGWNRVRNISDNDPKTVIT